LRDTLEQIDLVKRMSVAAPQWTSLARRAEEVDEIRASGRTAGLIGVEGGHSIENSIGALRGLADLGVRYMTLTHADSLDWADSATDEACNGGLTDLGRKVVREMNRLAMLVDISHVSAETMHDAIETSAAPVIASHSSARALADHPRNIADDVLEQIGRTSGVVMVNFFPGFLVPESAARTQEMFALYRRLKVDIEDEAEVEEAVRQHFEDDPLDPGDVTVVVDHIEHIARVAGPDCVGLGSDFDGVTDLPAGLEDVSCYPAITDELLSRGWEETEIRRVLGENALRVLRRAEEIAAAFD
jgi:membrane dipeptidase